MKKAVKLIVLSLLLSLVSCKDPNPKLNLYRKTSLETGFNTFVELMAYTKQESEFEEYYNILKKEFIKYHQLYDIYNNYPNINNLKTINDKAGQEKVKVDPKIIELLTLSKKLYIETNKNLDCSCGSVLKIYHSYREKGQELNRQGQLGTLPDLDQLTNNYQYCGYKYLEIDEKSNTVYLSHPLAQIDVGSLAKGYATEKVAQILKKHGLKHGVLNAGGNVKFIGPKPNNQKWISGIADPSQKVVSLLNFETTQNQTVVTSGNYQNYYLANNNTKVSHIIDFKTLRPANYYDSVTIVTSDSALADGFSTALFSLDYNSAIQMIKHLKKAFNISLEVIFVSKNKINKDSIYQNGFYINYTKGLKV